MESPQRFWFRFREFRAQRLRLGLRLLIEWESRHRVFLDNLADLLPDTTAPAASSYVKARTFLGRRFRAHRRAVVLVHGGSAVASDGHHPACVGAIENMGTSETRRAKQDSSGHHLLSANVVSGGGEQGDKGASSIAQSCGSAGGSPNSAASADAGSARGQAESCNSTRHQAGGGQTAGLTCRSPSAADGAVFGHHGIAAQRVVGIAGGGGTAGTG